jgi:hypothetical protein
MGHLKEYLFEVSIQFLIDFFSGDLRVHFCNFGIHLEIDNSDLPENLHTMADFFPKKIRLFLE